MISLITVLHPTSAGVSIIGVPEGLKKQFMQVLAEHRWQSSIRSDAAGVRVGWRCPPPCSAEWWCEYLTESDRDTALSSGREHVADRLIVALYRWIEDGICLPVEDGTRAASADG